MKTKIFYLQHIITKNLVVIYRDKNLIQYIDLNKGLASKKQRITENKADKIILNKEYIIRTPNFVQDATKHVVGFEQADQLQLQFAD